jgi:hypothetical protein
MRLSICRGGVSILAGGGAVVGYWWLVVGRWLLVAGCWWLVVGGWLGSVQKWDSLRLVISAYGTEPIAFARFPRGGRADDEVAAVRA